MTLTTQAGALRRAVQTALPFTEIRHSIPVLRCLMLHGGDGRLAIETTNMEAHMATACAAEGGLARVAVPAAPIAAMLEGQRSDAPVTLALEHADGPLRITCGGFHARFGTEPVEDFPQSSPMADARSVTLAAATLWRLIDRTMFAIRTEETRYYLNGIYLDREGEKFRAVATDGHRMMIADEPWPDGAEALPPGIMHSDVAAWLRTHLSQMPAGATVRLSMSDTRILVAAEDWALRAKLIDGTFPDYRRVLPPAEGAALVVSRPAALSRTLSRVQDICRNRVVPLALSRAEDGSLVLRNTTANLGTLEIAVPLDVARWEAEASPDLTLQARLLGAFCAAMPRGLTLHLRGRAEAVRVEGPDGVGALMPMRGQ